VTPPKTRRPRGTGSIYQRKSDQLWVGSVIVGTRPDGRPDRRAVYAKTKSDAQRKMRDVMRQRDRGELGDSGNTRATIQQWSEAWLTMHAHKVRPKTLATDRGVVRKWIVPTIGRRRLADLTPADVRKLRDAVTDAGNTTTTAAHAQRTLMTMLKAAVREGLTVPPRVFLVDMPSKSVNDRSAIPVDQALAMLRVARERPDATRWVAALLQGMRQGEALGLTWDCVNLDAGLLDVSWQLQSLTKGHATPDRWEARHLVDGYWLTRPKTNAGQRLIPLVPWMRAALVEARDSWTPNPYGLVWVTGEGGPISAAKDRAAWQQIQREAGAAHPSGRLWHVHEARHTTATMLLRAGVDRAIIEAILGQAVLVKSYLHVGQDDTRKALEGLSGALRLDG